jgi:hypothetical protein
MTPPAQPHYHWKWADTFHGGKNIDVFEDRVHIATVFSEDAAKRIIAGLRTHPAPAAPDVDVLNECYTELMKHATEAEGIDCIVLSDVEYVFGKLRQSQHGGDTSTTKTTPQILDRVE